MASLDQVRQYLAYWFQLGKRLVINNGQEKVLPQPVIQGNRYSPEFEACWQQVMQVEGRNCYLEGTLETINQLLSSEWDIESCARCDMPVPMLSLGMRDPTCPCSDLPYWPNTELPPPRSPVDSYGQLNAIRARLLKSGQGGQGAEQPKSYQPDSSES
ncbi:MAG: hypothetical protein Kow00121_20140 [Elainellaceae cyanobacterium]